MNKRHPNQQRIGMTGAWLSLLLCFPPQIWKANISKRIRPPQYPLPPRSQQCSYGKALIPFLSKRGPNETASEGRRLPSVFGSRVTRSLIPPVVNQTPTKLTGQDAGLQLRHVERSVTAKMFFYCSSIWFIGEHRYIQGRGHRGTDSS